MTKSRKAKSQPATDPREVLEQLQARAATGDCDALLDLAICCRDGLRDSKGAFVVEADRKGSLDWSRAGAVLGDPRAMVVLADALTQGAASEKNVAEATRWYRRAFELGSTTGAFNLGCTLQNLGRHTEAVRWFRKALDAGDLSALVPLAQAELHGVGTRRDVAAAMKKLTQIAKGGAFFCQFDREQAMLTLSETLRLGLLVPRDYAGALVWLRRAAELGSAAARGLLADLQVE
jgi:TPR repeat protein